MSQVREIGEAEAMVIARRVCTQRELDAFRLWQQSWGYERIADLLIISPSTARDRVRRARARIEREAASR